MSLVARMAVVVGALATVSVGAAALASCSHGNYDGSYEGGVDAGAADAGASVTRTVNPAKNETVTSDDGALQVIVHAGTFDAPTDITIASAGEQTLDNGLIVPIYAVSAAGNPTPKQPLLLVFTGGGTDNLPSNRTLIPTVKQADGSFAFLKVAGGGGQSNGGGGGSNGPSRSYWGLSSSLGVFSLTLTSGDQAAPFVDISTTSCTAKCCPSNAGGSNNVVTGSIGGSCFCGGTTPDLECLLKSCGDIDAAATRCSELGASAGAPIACPQPSSCQNCPAQQCTSGGIGQPGSVCCVLTSGSTSPCVQPPQTCPAAGLVVHCADSAQCTTGVCCLVGSETICAPSCPGEARVCTNSADCADAGVDAGDGGDGGCSSTARCGFGTCGAAPAACQ